MTPEEFIKRARQICDEHTSCWSEEGCYAKDEYEDLFEQYDRELDKDLTKED